MNKEKKLREKYEDAYFSLLMSEVARAKGTELLKENERLKADPDFDVPETVTQRSMSTIRREFVRQSGRQTVQFAGKIFSRAACVAVIAVLMLMTAYATIPSFRLQAQNLIVESTMLETFISLTEGEPAKEDPNVLLGYQIPEMPEGFELEAEWKGAESAWVRFRKEDGANIKIYVNKNLSHTIAIDTEDADAYDIQIQGYKGLICVEETAVVIAWNDSTTGMFLQVFAEGVDRTIIIKDIAERIIPSSE